MVNFRNIHRETTENSLKNVINSQALTETKYDFKNDNARIRLIDMNVNEEKEHLHVFKVNTSFLNDALMSSGVKLLC